MSNTNLSFATIVNSGFLWVLFGLALILYISVSAVLVYHWNHYSYAPRRVRQIKKLYFSVSLILLAVMLAALISLSANL